MTTEKQFFKNILLNFINFVSNVAQGLLLTPFLISHIGISNIGIIQIATSISYFFNIATTSINQANSRFIAVSIHNNDPLSTNSTLTITFIAYILCIIILAPLLITTSNVTFFFSIPEDNILNSTYLFICIYFSLFFIMITSALNSPVYVHNRLDIIQSINITRNLTKFILIISLIIFFENSLLSIGIAHLTSSIFAFLFALYFFKKFLPNYKFKFKDFNLKIAKNITSLSFWTVINQCGSLLFNQTDIILINIFINAEFSGKFAIIMQWMSLLMSLSTITSVALSPIIIIKFSQNKLSELQSFVIDAIKIQGLFFSIPLGLVIGYAPQILSIWIGEKYTDIAFYLQIMTSQLIITQTIRPLFALNTAYNKMKGQGLLTVSLGTLHIITSVVLLKFFKQDIGISIASNVIYNTALSLILIPWFSAKHTNINILQIYKSFLLSIISCFFVFLTSRFISHFLCITSLIHLLFSIIISIIISFFFIYLILSEKDKKTLKLFIIKFLKINKIN